MTERKYAKKCLEGYMKKTNSETPDLTSWCGCGSCGIVNYLLSELKKLREMEVSR